MPPKANLNAPVKKKAGGATGSSGAGANGAPGSPAPASSSAKSAQVSASKSFIVRPSASSKNLKAIMNVYMNLTEIRSIGLSAGEIVHLGKKGEPGIVAVLTPTAGPIAVDTIEISNQLRQLGGFLLGDRVVVSKYSGRPSFAPGATIGTDQEIEEKKVQMALESVGIVCAGLQFESDGVKFAIRQIGGDGLPDMASLSLDDDATTATNSKHATTATPYFFQTSKTKLTITPGEMDIDNRGDLPDIVRYSSIGGLKKQIAMLRSKIELPLHQPSLFKRFNMSPDRGFLLHGPPGTGKTMLLRAVANETNAHVLTINGPSIVSKYLGETESALRDIFEEARSYQPAIIFIDEIDALVPKRDSDESGEAESRVVSTLLTLMDGMGASGRVVVIGATNRPNSIDPALRRPGRFGQEIEIGIPDVEGRLEILSIQLERIPHTLKEEEINNLAAKTHGYVGADIYAVCRDAVMRAVQRGLDKGMSEEDMFVDAQDFENALVDIRPSAMREIFLETPKVHWTDVGGQEPIKQTLKEMVEWPLSHPDTFLRLGVNAPRGILLYGPPGCSKTLIAKALATEAGLNFLAVKGPELFNKFVGESERAVREIFSKARAASPSIIFFDEIDALSTARGSAEAGGDRVLTSLLNEMDGIEALNGVIILAATNLPDTIDSALMRPGRLDRLVYVGPPDLDARRKILQIQFQRMSIGADVDIEDLSVRTDGCSGAEVVSLCQEAGLLAMNESLDIDCVSKRHFEEALSKLKRAITKEMLEYFDEFSKSGR